MYTHGVAGLELNTQLIIFFRFPYSIIFHHHVLQMLSRLTDGQVKKLSTRFTGQGNPDLILNILQMSSFYPIAKKLIYTTQAKYLGYVC